MKPKPKHDGWCAFDPEGKPVRKTYDKKRKGAGMALEFLMFMIPLKRLRKEGYRVKKVKIVEVK